MTSLNSTNNTLVVVKQDIIRLYISTITDKCFTIYAYASFSIGMVKRSLAEQLELSYLQCHLLFNQRVLENWRSLSFYGIGDEANLELFFNLQSGPYLPFHSQVDSLYVEIQQNLFNQKQMYEIYEPGKEEMRTYLTRVGDHFNIYRFILKGDGVESCEKEILKVPCNKKNNENKNITREVKQTEPESSYQRKLQNKITKTKVNILKQLMKKNKKQERIEKTIAVKAPTYLIYERKYHLKRRNESSQPFKVLGSILIKRNYSFCKKTRKKRVLYNYLELNIKIPKDPISYSSYGSNLIMPCINHDVEQDRMKKEALTIFNEEKNLSLVESNSLLFNSLSFPKTDGKNKYLSSLDEIYMNNNSTVLDDDKKRMRQEASFLFQKESNIFNDNASHLSKQPNSHLSEPFLPSLRSKHKRCGFCNKKLNITNIYLCRCNKEYCVTHRLAEAHECTFDYRSHGRKIIEKENPLVIAPKNNKI